MTKSCDASRADKILQTSSSCCHFRNTPTKAIPSLLHRRQSHQSQLKRRNFAEEILRRRDENEPPDGVDVVFVWLHNVMIPCPLFCRTFCFKDLPQTFFLEANQFHFRHCRHICLQFLQRVCKSALVHHAAEQKQRSKIV